MSANYFVRDIYLVNPYVTQARVKGSDAVRSIPDLQ